MDRERVVLIIGDWVIDEYWFLVKHQSDISSHVGFNHYRLNDRNNQYIRDLCGAGHIMRLLYQNSMNGKHKISFLGIGIWNKKDNHLIKHLIHSQLENVNCMVGKFSKSMTLSYCDDEIPIKIWSIDPEGTTIRVVRQWKRKGSSLHS